MSDYVDGRELDLNRAIESLSGVGDDPVLTSNVKAVSLGRHDLDEGVMPITVGESDGQGRRGQSDLSSSDQV